MLTAAAFDSVAPTYDAVFTTSPIGRAQRNAVWQEMDRVFTRGMRVLEINCGTGIDAIHMAERGVDVFACDASRGMIEAARQNLRTSSPACKPHFMVLPIARLGALQGGPFDGALSNFSGLNCVADLNTCAGSLARLVARGGRVLLCIFGRHCIWEMAWYLVHRQSQKAFRRWTDSPVEARLDDSTSVTIRYPGVRDMKSAFLPWFRLVSRKGIGIFVPPSFADTFVQRHTRAFDIATSLDLIAGRVPLLRDCADHILFEFQRTAVVAPERPAQ